MTTTTEMDPSPVPEKIERADSPESASVENSAPKAAVGFDTADQKLRVITADDIADAAEKGDLVDVDGRMLTILEFCDSVESARASCEEHANGMNGMGLSSIRYEHDEDDDTTQETSTSGLEDKDDGMIEIEDGGLGIDNTADGIGALDASAFGGVAFGVVAELQQQIDEMKNTMRDAIAITMNDLQFDMDRLHQKQENLVHLYQKMLGTGRDGRLMAPFSEKYPSKPFDGSHVSARPTGKNPEEIINTHFSDLEKMWANRQAENENYVRNELLSNPLLMGPRAKPKISTTTSAIPSSSSSTSKRVVDTAENGEQEYTFGTNGTQGKRIVNGIVKSVEKLSYPFITREEEEECLESANGQAPIYAQLLAKLLFVDTIMMYFKDQDTAKRNWLHDAVDYRFPTLDKPTHVSKWKNCSFFINKNMREAVIASGSSMPRAPCGPRGPIGPKDKFKNDQKGSEDVSTNEEEEEDAAVVRTPKPKQTARVNRESSLEGIDWEYLDSDYEKECYEECRGDQYKYAELMALRLFSTSLTIKFKEQDQVRKEWLRACVEARFPIEDRERNDQRWKICGQTCNRNRTKVVGADGREERYPYFDQSIEEECFRQSDGQPSLYAELMNAKLFPTTQHLFFKDQDLGKRNWLHTILDKRFPSTDKVTQTSKWKACTNAINKKLFDGTVTPITKEALFPTASVKVELEDSKVSVPETPEDTPRSSVARFERRRLPSEAPSVPGSLKRKATEDVETPVTPAAKRESIRNKQKKEKELYSAYPYVSEEEEVAILESANGNPQVYGRELGRILFADTIKNYFKDQDPDKRQWIHEILDFRFPSKNQLESKQKWKNVTAAINRNMTTAVVSRRSLPR
ncbi:hypothetical protein B9Z55_014049 [Caenorhabditis nigoni]|uniref:Uncharacterized protein n=1 Tax=Caenorhabditis nigoni TaxID=1611254 RepID=A0A2G5U4C8_9PELO|nr:hypothetical protein B9Z55_014049 [Caenorhabditis nigoni]